ncbi:cirhin-like, partial [Trifolium medium]|nr:cirhin-like [Trifolium medium]
MAVTLPKSSVIKAERKGGRLGNGHGDSDESENSESDEDSESPATVMQSVLGFPRVAIGYDDGHVGIYAISDTDEFMHVKSLLRV